MSEIVIGTKGITVFVSVGRSVFVVSRKLLQIVKHNFYKVHDRVGSLNSTQLNFKADFRGQSNSEGFFRFLNEVRYVEALGNALRHSFKYDNEKREDRVGKSSLVRDRKHALIQVNLLY